jgi:hypothetical protein
MGNIKHGAFVAAGSLLGAFAAAACGSPPHPVTTASIAAERRDVERERAIPDRAWAMVESRRHFVSLPLPDRTAWRIDETPLWLSASHVASKSMLWVRTWRAGSVVSHVECEAEARTYRPDLFGRDPSALVDRRPLGVPAGFDTELAFSVRRTKDALGGVAVAVGANVRECIVMAYATRADGEGASEAVSHRLAFVADRIFARVLWRKVEDRVVPERAATR